MKITWEDGDVQEIPFGQQLVGLQRKGKRPLGIYYTEEEFPKDWPIAKVEKYIHTIIKKARTQN